MLETSSRLLRLLALLSARASWTGPDLAAALGTSLRTVRRDVARLRTLGYPVVGAPGPAGSYRLGAGTALPPLVLDDEAAAAVVVGLRSTTAAGVSGLEDAAARALAVVERLLPAAVRARVDALGSATDAVADTAATDAAVLAAAAAATADRVEVRLAYRDRSGATTRRRVEPHRVVRVGRHWYLLGWDRDREDWRTFRLDRVEDLHVTTFAVTARAVPDAVALVRRSVAVAGYPLVVRARVHAPLADVASQVHPASVVLTADGPDACLLEAGVEDLTTGLARLLALDVDLTVLDPPELVELARRWAARLGRAAPGT